MRAGFGAVGGTLIFLTSWIVLAYVFPQAVQEMIDGNVAAITGGSMDPEAKAKQIAAVQEMSAWSQSIAGLLGTFFTSVLVAAVAAAFVRKK